MRLVRKLIPLMVVGGLASSDAFAETYTPSYTSPTSTSTNSDTDGNFTIQFPQGLWTGIGPISRRYGTAYERRILPDGSVITTSYSISPGTNRNYASRLSGTTEIYQIKHCYEYLDNAANFHCTTSPAYLTVQSFPIQVSLTNQQSNPPAPGTDLIGGTP